MGSIQREEDHDGSLLSWRRGVQPSHPELAPARCAKYEVAERVRIVRGELALSGPLSTAALHGTDR